MALRSRRAAACATLSLALAACTVGPNFQRPHVASPARYGATPRDVPSTFSDGAVEDAWWDGFGDPELTSLVRRLVRQNLDLQSAAERIAQARAQRGVARAQGLPQIEAAPKYTRERESANGVTSLLEPAPGAPLEFDLFQPQVQASWELDLFGRVRRAVEAAQADTDAAVSARRGVALAALSDLAQAYLELRSLQARQALVEATVRQTDARRALVRDRYRNGVATLADVSQADAQTAGVAEGVPDLRTAQARDVNAIGLLLGEAPRALEGELRSSSAPPPTPPSVPTGLPSELLRRRPDIVEAEARLHAATARTGVAVADFYPQVTLNGQFGFESLNTKTLFDWSSRAFMAGPTVTLPIFEGGRLKSQLQFRRAAEREAALQYRQEVLQAWREVDDAMTAYAEAQHREREVGRTVEADGVALRVAEDRYRQGAGAFIEVTLAQADLLRAKDAATDAHGRTLATLVTLYRALGGGWRSAEPPSA